MDEADLCRGVALCQSSNLSFADHVHRLIALDGSLCSRERAEAEARLDSSFDRTVILLDDIVEVGDHAAPTSLAECMTPLQLVDHFWVRRIPVYIDHSRARVIRCSERFAEEGLSGRHIARLRKEEVDGCAGGVHRSI